MDEYPLRRMVVTAEGAAVISGNSQSAAGGFSFATVRYEVVPPEVLQPSVVTLGPVNNGQPISSTATNASPQRLTVKLQSSPTNAPQELDGCPGRPAGRDG